jgi:hypothetical protein
MYRWCNNHPEIQSKDRLGSCLPQAQHKDWDDLALRNGHGAAQDFLYIQ